MQAQSIVNHGLLNFKQAARRPSLADIQQFLIQLPADMKVEEVYTVIDALDECPEGIDRMLFACWPRLWRICYVLGHSLGAGERMTLSGRSWESSTPMI